MPQKFDRFGVRHRKFVVQNHGFRDRLFKEVITEVILHGDALKPRFAREDFHRFRVHREVKRHAGDAATGIKARRLNPIFRQHRRFDAGPVHRRHPRTGHLVRRTVARHDERRCGNMHADPLLTVPQIRNACRIIDFRRLGVVDGEGFYRRLRKFHVRRLGRRQLGESRAAREILSVKTPHMPSVGTFYGTDFEQQPQRAQMFRIRCRRKRLPFHAVFIGIDEKRKSLRRNFLGNAPGLHFRNHLVTPLFHHFPFLHRGKRTFQYVRRRLFVVSAPLAVEINGITVQRHQRCSPFHRTGIREIVRGNRVVPEFLIGRHFPQKSRIHVRRRSLRLGDEVRRRRRFKFKKDVPPLHFGTPSRGQFDLICRPVLLHDVAGLEDTVFFEK